MLLSNWFLSACQPHLAAVHLPYQPSPAQVVTLQTRPCCSRVPGHTHARARHFPSLWSLLLCRQAKGSARHVLRQGSSSYTNPTGPFFTDCRACVVDLVRPGLSPPDDEPLGSLPSPEMAGSWTQGRPQWKCVAEGHNTETASRWQEQ